MKALAGVCDLAIQAVRCGACRSRRAWACGEQGRCDGRAVGAAVLDDVPVPELAMRAALDVDGRHAAAAAGRGGHPRHKLQAGANTGSQRTSDLTELAMKHSSWAR